ncbi:MAG TPA: FAD-dependent oxidoreductase [Gemmatimonadales bacterium]
MSSHILVVGAGVFGASAAVALRGRGHAVTLIDQGPIPHPLAASTDASKVVRIAYGGAVEYVGLAEQAYEGWLRWNQEWVAGGGEALYHPTGVLMVCQDPMQAGGFEHESWRVLVERGHSPERLDAAAIRARAPAWASGAFVDGFYHEKGGYAESSRVVEALVRKAEGRGVVVTPDQRVAGVLERDRRVVGITLSGGDELRADHVVVAAGAWTGKLLGLEPSIRPSGHPVFYLRPRDPDPFRPERFPVFTADVARTGYYGFPLNRDGLVKIANHGRGVSLDPDAPREVSTRDRERLWDFLAGTFPDLDGAELVSTRLCLYADTQDEDFWIARDPDRDGLTVASGGSGHGFKFAPVLGPIIADVVEGRATPWSHTFRWRPELRLDRGREAARAHDVE